MKSTQEKIREAAEDWIDRYQADYTNAGHYISNAHQQALREGYIEGANFVLSLDRWVSVEEALPEKSPVLVAFLEQRFGQFGYEIGVGYYDSPSHYENPEEGTGWRFWIPDRKIVGKGVTHWQPLPTPPNTKER